MLVKAFALVSLQQNRCGLFRWITFSSFQGKNNLQVKCVHCVKQHMQTAFPLIFCISVLLWGTTQSNSSTLTAICYTALLHQHSGSHRPGSKNKENTDLGIFLSNIFKHSSTLIAEKQPHSASSKKLKVFHASVIWPHIYNLDQSGNISLSNHQFQLCLGIWGC